jgi:hypothetical protein
MGYASHAARSGLRTYYPPPSIASHHDDEYDATANLADAFTEAR